MSVNKKGFAQIVESAIMEYKNVHIKTNEIVEKLYSSSIEDKQSNKEYQYRRCMEKLVNSKIKRLYSILSIPAKNRILDMKDEEVEEYKEEKLSEITTEINRLMLGMEVAKADTEKSLIKKQIEDLMQEEGKLKEMAVDELKTYFISKLELDNENVESFDGIGETEVLEKIVNDDKVLTEFSEMLKKYRKLERQIKETRAEQIIIYNELLTKNNKLSINIDEIFSEESLNNIQNIFVKTLNEVNSLEDKLKDDFSNKKRKSYERIISSDYKYDIEKIEPYKKSDLDNFQSIISERIYELATLQNIEWKRINKKIFKTSDMRKRSASLSMEIDETKELIDTYIRDWYRYTYYDNSMFGPISSRANGKFEYSLGAKYLLDEFVNYGGWPTETDVISLKQTIRLNKLELEKSIIYIEQIKERFSRLYTTSLSKKKEELFDLENKMTGLVGNWKNPVILSIIDCLK